MSAYFMLFIKLFELLQLEPVNLYKLLTITDRSVTCIWYRLITKIKPLVFLVSRYIYKKKEIFNFNYIRNKMLSK